MNMHTKSISVAEYLVQHQAGGPPLTVDVRTSAEVASECYPSACCLPLQDLTAESFAAVLCSNEDAEGGCEEQPVYLLCGSGNRASKAAEQLSQISSRPLVVIDGGINAMKQAGVELRQGDSRVISLERQVRIAAGTLIVLGVVLGTLLDPLFYGLSAFVGAGLVFAGVTDSCGMAMVLARMPWNAGAR